MVFDDSDEMCLSAVGGKLPLNLKQNFREA